MNAVVGAVAVQMINPYVGILAIKMGADDLQLGYLSSWPNAVSVVAVLFAAAAVAGSTNKQRVIAGIMLLGRLAAIGVAMVPWFPERFRVWALIGFWVLFVFPGSAAGTAMQSFLADVFPGQDRGRELAARQSWGTGAGMVVAFGTGWLLDRVLPYPAGYQMIFAVSFLVSLWEIALFLQLREQAAAPSARPAARPQRQSLRTYLSVFDHRPFAHFALVSLLFHFTWQMAWPMFTRYQVSILQADNTWLSLVGVANSLASIITYPLWARLAERYGNRTLMPVAAIWLSSAPILTVLSPNMQVLTVTNLFTGVSVAGVMLLLLNNLLEVSPAQNRPLYLAVHAALVSISASIAPMAGAYVISAMPINSGLWLASLLRFCTGSLFFLLIYRYGSGKGNRAEPEKLSESEAAV